MWLCGYDGEGSPQSREGSAPSPTLAHPILIHTCTSFCMMLAALVCALQDTSAIWGREEGMRRGIRVASSWSSERRRR